MATKSDPFGFAAAINWDAVDEHADEIAAIFERETVRHMFDFPNNDGATPLCHNLLTGGALVRQVITNVNCPACLDLFQRAQED